MAKETVVETKLTGSEIRKIELERIFSNIAQSRGMGVLSRLQNLGYGLFESITVDKKPIWAMLFSDLPEDQVKAVELIEEHEPEIASLAKSQRAVQLEPIGIRELSDGEYDVIFGMRRAIAAAFNMAKYNDEPDTVEAKVFSFEEEPTMVQLKFMALEENDNREGESPIDKALTFQSLRKAGISSTDIATKIRMSKKYVDNHLLLLDKKIADLRMKIHSGKLKIDPALKELAKRKNGETNEGGARAGEGKNAARFRLPSNKGIMKIYDAGKKPAKMDQEEWSLWILPDVRKFIAFKLGLKFTEFTPSAQTNGHSTEPVADPPKVLKVKRKRAVKLLVSLGKTNAATWDDTVLKGKLEGIVNIIEVGQRSENDSLNKLLDMLLAEYPTGLKVEIVAD